MIIEKNYISEFLNNWEITEVENKSFNLFLKHHDFYKLEEDEKRNYFCQKLADKVAEFGKLGFYYLFHEFLVVWILLNVFWLSNHGFIISSIY